MRDDVIRMCVDRNLPLHLRREARRLSVLENPENGGRGALALTKKWRPGRVLRVRFLDGVSEVHEKVEQAAMEWTEHANLDFSFGLEPDAEIRISFNPGAGSWSLVGTDALAAPREQPTMNLGWLSPRSPDSEYARLVKHEFGHALGLIHEHQHPDTGIPWDKPAVYDHYVQALGWTREEVDANLFKRYGASATQFSAYDRESIMHYPVDDRLTAGDYAIGWNTRLSETDKEFIRRVYPGRHRAARPPAFAPVLAGPIAPQGEQRL